MAVGDRLEGTSLVGHSEGLSGSLVNNGVKIARCVAIGHRSETGPINRLVGGTALKKPFEYGNPAVGVWERDIGSPIVVSQGSPIDTRR